MRYAVHIAALLAVLGLGACGDWPDLGLDDEVEGFPRLVPFDEVVAPAEIAGEEADAAAQADADLIDRAEALRDRAAVGLLTDEDRDAFDALRRRAPPGR
jgi:hypothetical protein